MISVNRDRSFGTQQATTRGVSSSYWIMRWMLEFGFTFISSNSRTVARLSTSSIISTSWMFLRRPDDLVDLHGQHSHRYPSRPRIALSICILWDWKGTYPHIQWAYLRGSLCVISLVHAKTKWYLMICFGFFHYIENMPMINSTRLSYSYC